MRQECKIEETKMDKTRPPIYTLFCILPTSSEKMQSKKMQMFCYELHNCFQIRITKKFKGRLDEYASLIIINLK